MPNLTSLFKCLIFFLLLFLGFSLIYLILQKKTTARLLFVTLFSYYFYYKSSGTYFFLLSSYYGAINRLADGGEARYRGYRLAAASGPILVLVLLAHSVRTLGAGACLTYALLCLPIAPTLYFSIKHLILPDVDLGIIRVMRPYNACVIVFCMVQVLLQAPACSGLDIRAAGSVLSSVLLMTLLPMAEMGVRKWFI